MWALCLSSVGLNIYEVQMLVRFTPRGPSPSPIPNSTRPKQMQWMNRPISDLQWVAGGDSLKTNSRWSTFRAKASCKLFQHHKNLTHLLSLTKFVLKAQHKDTAPVLMLAGSCAHIALARNAHTRKDKLSYRGFPSMPEHKNRGYVTGKEVSIKSQRSL